MKTLPILLAALLPVTLSAADAPKPDAALAPQKPFFQNTFFFSMPRVFCVIQKVDLQARTIDVKVDKDGSTKTVAVEPDTELLFRNATGTLEDYFPGQHVMLFIYGDEDRNWVGLRAIQDDIQMTAMHNWFAAVTKIDRTARHYWTHRVEKNDKGEVTKEVDQDHVYAADAKIWKGETPGGPETLLEGDEVIQQLVEKNGEQIAVELLDRKGAEAVKLQQEERYKAYVTEKGVPCYVADLNVLNGGVSLAFAPPAIRFSKDFKVGDQVLVAPGDGSHPLAAAIYEMGQVGARRRIELLTNAFAGARLKMMENVRVFFPGTGGALPEGKSGIPTPPPPAGKK